MSVMQLADFLAPFDYAPIELVRAGTGHLRLASSSVNGRPIMLYLDTGAGRTVLDLACARRLGLTLHESAQGGGLGAAEVRAYRGTVDRLALGPIEEKNITVHALDLTHMNQALAARGEAPMDGVVGADLLDAREAVIDYRQLRLFLKRIGHARSLAA